MIFWSALQDFSAGRFASLDDDTFDKFTGQVNGERCSFMTLKYLLDTNVLSEAKRPQPNQKVMTKLRLSKREIATATLVIHELLFGCFRLPLSKKRQDLEDYVNNVILANLPLFDYDLKSA